MSKELKRYTAAMCRFVANVNIEPRISWDGFYAQQVRSAYSP